MRPLTVTSAAIMEQLFLLMGGKYTGRVIEAYPGFSFIGDIKAKASDQAIFTNGEVFVPMEFAPGAAVDFEGLEPDPKRNGKYRTSLAKIAPAGTSVNANSAKEALMQLSRRQTYHATAKQVDPDLVELAVNNLPFNEILQGIIKQGYGGTMPQHLFQEMATKFFLAKFSTLCSIGVSTSVKGDVDKGEEEKLINDFANKYRHQNLAGQVNSLEKEYRNFLALREIFTKMYEGKIGYGSLLPIKYLPDLTCAVPVWFTQTREDRQILSENKPLGGHSNTAIAESDKYFSALIGSWNFSCFFQIYNLKSREFSQFAGKDIIPGHVLETIEWARYSFDHLVIATPYLDLPTEEWLNKKGMMEQEERDRLERERLRSIDPFLLGFVRDVPYVFLLERWSGTGLFPLIPEMIANTMDHLRQYSGLLRYINKLPVSLSSDGDISKFLPRFAEDTVKAFKRGNLFDFLREA